MGQGAGSFERRVDAWPAGVFVHQTEIGGQVFPRSKQTHIFIISFFISLLFLSFDLFFGASKGFLV